MRVVDDIADVRIQPNKIPLVDDALLAVVGSEHLRHVASVALAGIRRSGVVAMVVRVDAGRGGEMHDHIDAHLVEPAALSVYDPRTYPIDLSSVLSAAYRDTPTWDGAVYPRPTEAVVAVLQQVVRDAMLELYAP